MAVRSAAPEVLAAADELIDTPGEGGWAQLVAICERLDAGDR